jgi:hypothetical protein
LVILARIKVAVVYNIIMEQTNTTVSQAPRAAGSSAVVAAGREALGELLVAPLWWYTGGLLRVVRWWWAQLGEGAKRLSLRVLISHWTQPMYGQYDVAGRIISLVLRTVVLVWHVLIMNIWIVMVTVALAVYVLLPVVAVWQLLINLG